MPSLIEYMAEHHIGTVPLELVRISESGITFTFEGLTPENTAIMSTENNIIQLIVTDTPLAPVHKEYLDYILATQALAETERKAVLEAYKETHKDAISAIEAESAAQMLVVQEANSKLEEIQARLREHGDAAVAEANATLDLKLDIEKGKTLKSAYLGKPC